MIRWLHRLGFVLVVLYAAYGAVMVWLHPQFIYPFSQEPFAGKGYSRIEVAVLDADPLALQVHEGQVDQPVTLYFMGNVGALEVFRFMLDHHKQQGRGVVGMTYRGGGGEPGASSETTLKRDALAAFDAVRQQFPGRPIIVQGYSLGTGLAVHVAARRDAAGVILSAPYTRMCALMAVAAKLPACQMPVQRWDSIADAPDIRTPVLVLHGTQDQLIPFQHSRDLMAVLAEAGVGAELVPITGAGHTNLTQFADYASAIDAFVLAANGGSL